jgi:hypothetical protein
MHDDLDRTLEVGAAAGDERLVRFRPHHRGDSRGALHEELIDVIHAVIEPKIRCRGVPRVNEWPVAGDNSRDVALVLEAT